MCPSCPSPSPPGAPCARCRADLAPAPVRRSRAGLVVRSAWVHSGTARRLVHRLKYEGAADVAALLAAALVPLVPAACRVLVPVPRAPLRVWRYGIDPAAALADALGALTDLAVVRSLRGPWWWPHHAGRTAAARGAPRFRLVGPIGPGMVLVDDVVTTGVTLDAATAALRGAPILGLTATAAGTLSVRDTDPRHTPGEAGWR